MTAYPVVGVDMVEVSRFDRILARHPERFVRRYFTDGERATCNGSAKRLAARWAAKEACAKALGTGLGPIRAREIEVVTDTTGAPKLQLHGNALAQASALGFHDCAVSLSHTDHSAIAVVVAMRHDG